MYVVCKIVGSNKDQLGHGPEYPIVPLGVAGSWHQLAAGSVLAPGSVLAACCVGGGSETFENDCHQCTADILPATAV